MWFYEVAPTKIVRSGVSTFTYHAASQLKPGHVVTIPVGKQTLQGVIISEVTKPTYDTKEITSVIEARPLPAHLVALAQWLSVY